MEIPSTIRVECPSLDVDKADILLFERLDDCSPPSDSTDDLMSLEGWMAATTAAIDRIPGLQTTGYPLR